MYHLGLLALQQAMYSTLYIHDCRVCWLLLFVPWAVWVKEWAIVTMLQAARYGFWTPAETCDFSLLWNVQTGCGTSQPLIQRVWGFFPGGKVAGVRSLNCVLFTFLYKGKVKCTLVQALRLCTGHRGSRGIALPFLDHGTRRGWGVWGVSVMPWPLFTLGKDPVPIVQEAGWAPGPVWISAENLAPTRIRSPDHPACSQSLYRLRYLVHTFCIMSLNFHWSKKW
jgi:hypothetical protein